MQRKWVNSPYIFALGMFAMMVPSQAFSSYYSFFYVEKLGLGIGLATLAHYFSRLGCGQQPAVRALVR